MSGGFRHLHAAHCESGVTAALLRHQGLEISEPLAFGIGSGLFFFYPPLVRIMGMPVISYRSYPGSIFRKVCRRLGISYRSRTFLLRARGIRQLDTLLDDGTPVGLQANIFWLSYFPREFRHQFNGHNLVATGRDGSNYIISDPVLPQPVRCPADALHRARFARGPLSPRGRLYFPSHVPKTPELRGAILVAIRDVCHTMLRIPVPFGGVKGIRYLAGKVREWPRRLGHDDQLKLHIGHIIRMQEEVGTGGAGFRFMYAAFLQEAGGRLAHEPFLRGSEMMTAAGDAWRSFAVSCARLIKGRDGGQVTCDSLADEILACAELERQAFQYLLDRMPRRS